ncbi:MAG: methyltransferase regulatory domain-containing protein [Planctomycetales bacterium]|nr:methyltransferase regulatory domain-containing protein [Planctomycetales bacterium]
MTERPETDFAYDRMPYPGIADPEAHPRQLEALATFFGMQPQSLSSARVLEIGCASGKHLLPMALDYPQAQFVGVDLSGEQIQAARAVAERLELSNVEFRHNNLLEIDACWGEFDYILCPGVFSWVPPELQAKILEISRRNLAPQGVAIVSYNTYPGWHFYRVARDAMRYHALQFQEPQRQVSEARGALQFFAANSPETTMHGRLYRNRAGFLGRAADSYLYHDYLVHDNWPLYFHEFIERAESNDLQLVSEADYARMTSAFYPPGAREELAKLSLVHREQVLDFLRNQSYRKTILCRRDVALDRQVDLEGFGRFQLTLAQIPEPQDFDLSSEEPLEFRSALGSFRTASPFGKAALRCLIDCFPHAIAFDDLFQRTRDVLPKHVQPQTHGGKTPRDVLALSMVAMMNAGLLRVYLHAPRIAASVSDRPQVSPLARIELEQGDAVTNQRHDVLRLDDFAMGVVRLLDGSRDIERLLREAPPAANQEVDRDAMCSALEKLYRLAMLVA